MTATDGFTTGTEVFCTKNPCLGIGVVQGPTEFDDCVSVKFPGVPRAATFRSAYLRPVPPADVRDAAPTVETVKEWPYYYIGGPGYAAAWAVLCDHDYRLTDSCPSCP